MSQRFSLSSTSWHSGGCKDAQAKGQEAVRVQCAAAGLCPGKGSGQNPGSFLPGFERGGRFELILRHFLPVLLLVLQLDGTKLIVWSVVESSEIIFKSIKNKQSNHFLRNKGCLYYFF